MVTRHFDIIIVGAGIVGAALAAALRNSGLNLALIEPRPPHEPAADWDTRIYAISPGSVALLQHVNAWQRIDSSRLTPVHAMQVHGDGNARLVLDAIQSGVPQLAWIAEAGHIQYALWQTLVEQPNLTIFCPGQGRSLHWSAQQARLELDDDQCLSADLVVAADGRASWVREQAGIIARRDDYHQSGVVANFSCERPHRHIARQWFRDDGILAWLPLSDRAISMVWSTATEHANCLLAYPPEQLAQQVAIAGQHALGKLQALGQAAAFPLSLLRVNPIVRPGLALIGDAAHGVHPLSGQGVNLGLRDVSELAAVLLDRQSARCGDLPLLERYARARRADILTTQSVTDGLYHLFHHQHPLLARLRNIGLNTVARLDPVKSWLVQQSLI